MSVIEFRNERELLTGSVLAVCRSREHTFSKKPEERILLLPGLGVEGDAHMGSKVQHRSRVAKDPNQPNLRQVHLIQSELFYDLRKLGYEVRCGQMGENITTSGIDLLGLPAGSHLHIGSNAIVEITGLRNPCAQLDQFQDGLMSAVLDRDQKGNIVRKAGVMAIVLAGGEVCPGDGITVRLPEGIRRSLEVV